VKLKRVIHRLDFVIQLVQGSKEAIYSFQVLVQRDVNHNVYTCFIDYQKAFDRVEHDKLVKILEEIGLTIRN